MNNDDDDDDAAAAASSAQNIVISDTIPAIPPPPPPPPSSSSSWRGRKNKTPNPNPKPNSTIIDRKQLKPGRKPGSLEHIFLTPPSNPSEDPLLRATPTPAATTAGHHRIGYIGVRFGSPTHYCTYTL
ncbi:hypothetical protein EX30DRAFT_350453 [Ascodesmis nigricans]|uniref:Uncharacterized protein n=1 Tax=Ascodesmis nigricans TaxID=341454 RepID=A0A4S2MPL5_9PEZI|nr:hypothetical protein EX30DRAFT_350453 [Ascodesmis nigricans]